MDIDWPYPTRAGQALGVWSPFPAGDETQERMCPLAQILAFLLSKLED